jgi:hypothetical protein
MVGDFIDIGLLLHVQLGRIRVSFFGQLERMRCKHARPTTPQSRVRETDLFPREVLCHFTIRIGRFRRRPCSIWSSGLTSGSFWWGGAEEPLSELSSRPFLFFCFLNSLKFLNRQMIHSIHLNCNIFKDAWLYHRLFFFSPIFLFFIL